MLLYLLLCSFFFGTWANCPTDTICDPTFNKCYKFVAQVKSFYEAEESCVAFGGHLVSIKNAFENAIIGETAASMFNGQTDFWIGANFILKNEWSWTDESGWSYTNWFPGEPKANEAVSVILNSNLWQSLSPSLDKPFVCQLPSGSTNVPTSMTCPKTACPKTTCPTMKPEKSSPICESGWTWYSGTNHCYKAFFQETFWEAEHQCTEYGAHLVSIHSMDENSFVGALAGCGVPWDIPNLTAIGLFLQNGQWTWVDNSTVNFNNIPPGANVHGSCAIMHPDGWSGGSGWYQKWQGMACSTKWRNYICKKPAQS